MIDLAIELVDYGGEEPQRELITCVPEAGDVTAMGTYITLHHSDPLTLINDRTVLAVRSSNWSCSPIEWEFEIGKNS